MFGFNGFGCSGMTLSSADGKHFWARNYDFPSAEGSTVTLVPRGFDIPLMQDPACEDRLTSRYACLGMGAVGQSAAPVLYDGVNERGLCGGTLFYPGFATYDTNPSATSVNPAFAVTLVLATCADLDEAVAFFTGHNLSSEQVVPGYEMPMHFFLSDRSGEAVVIEPDAGGLSVHRDTIGVLANAPDYDWHVKNLRNYLTLTPEQPRPAKVLGLDLAPYGVGAGSLGLPGDFTPPSRFVRLAYVKANLPEPANEVQAVTYLFGALGSVAMPEGFVRNESGVGEKTLYTSAMCAESLTYYTSPFSNRRITAYRLSDMVDATELRTFSLPLEQDIDFVDVR